MSAGLERSSTGDEVLTHRFPVHRACRDGDVGALVSLLEQLSDLEHLTAEDSSYGWTPLHWAAHYGQLECVVRLVQVGCEVNTVTSRFNQTATHSAAFGGHPHCLVWLMQAGADVNQQDLIGETPIHKAARCGSLECVQVLLIAGAKPHLRNASGQTAADLAHAHGFHDCFCLIFNATKHLRQLTGLHGNSAPCGQNAHSRKRQMVVMEMGHIKKARRAECEEVEMENVETSQELSSEEARPPPSLPPSPPPAAPLSSRRTSAEMCGSLHQSGSPSSCVSHRQAWWGPAGGMDSVDFLHYGHYHGFGDTAEELSDGNNHL